MSPPPPLRIPVSAWFDPVLGLLCTSTQQLFLREFPPLRMYSWVWALNLEDLGFDPMLGLLLISMLVLFLPCRASPPPLAGSTFSFPGGIKKTTTRSILSWIPASELRNWVLWPYAWFTTCRELEVSKVRRVKLAVSGSDTCLPHPLRRGESLGLASVIWWSKK